MICRYDFQPIKWRSWWESHTVCGTECALAVHCNEGRSNGPGGEIGSRKRLKIFLTFAKAVEKHAMIMHCV
jgi:hypothetical protein